ncbi:MAG: PQQ-like beta-propeller repeat protein, partial [Candidatus Latescibacteria bacterium]|nr:PQQ-like beta-propeller repeat protein [Candidatus Latescibacterota bacterium]
MDEETEKGLSGFEPYARAWYAASVGTAVVAGLFSVVVIGVLVFYDVQSRYADPLDSPDLRDKKAALVQDPRNESLKEDFRDLDLKLRAQYFSHRKRAEQGGILLMVGVALFLVGIKSVAFFRKKDPMPEPIFEDQPKETRVQEKAIWSVLTVGVFLAGAALMGVTSVGGSRQAFWAAVEGNLSESVALDAYPTPEEIAANWPRFRGPGGLGRTDHIEIPSSWDGKSGRGILWKTPIPLPGRNSPIVWGDRVFLTGATEEAQEIYCFDAVSGKLLWRRAAMSIDSKTAEAPEVLKDTGFAAPTAVTDGQRVYAIFANGDLACFDFTGLQVWMKNMGSLWNQYGHASSLAMYQNLVLVLLDQGSGDEGRSALFAIDGRTGRTVWKAPRAVGNSWASPIVISTEAGEQVITCASPWVIAYDPVTGAEIWRVNFMEGEIAPSPIYASGLVFAVHPDGDLTAIRPTGQGDVTETHVAWTGFYGLPDICSPVGNDELVFLLTSDDGMLTCYDAKGGEMVWEADLDG